MEATTTRASTVSRSMPTRETRTHASMTMPLSRTRSRTSMRLVPPEALSTGIGLAPLGAVATHARLDRRSVGHRLRAVQLRLQQAHPLAQRLVFRRQGAGFHGEIGIVAPPVEADLLGLVDGAH